MAAKANDALADAINLYVGSPLRMLTASLTGWLPFSLAEGLLMASPILLAVLIALAVKYTKHSLRAGIRYVCVLLGWDITDFGMGNFAETGF